jgi:DNA-binding MarR family transcriptional regulator
MSNPTHEVSVPPGTGRSESDQHIVENLETLFAEVLVLAIQLSKTARTLHRSDRLPSGGRALLQFIERTGPHTVPQVARARATSRQNIQMLVNQLEALGLMEFIANPAHKRSDLLRITPDGRALLNRATEREAKFLAPLLSHAREADVVAAAELLQKIRLLLAEELPSSSAKRRPKAGFRGQDPSHRTSPATEPAVSSEMEAHSPPDEAPDDEIPLALL